MKRKVMAAHERLGSYGPEASATFDGWLEFEPGQKVTLDEVMGTFRFAFAGTIDAVDWFVRDGEKRTTIYVVGSGSQP